MTVSTSPHSLEARSAIVSSTTCTSVELPAITRSTSAVAVCSSSDPCRVRLLSSSSADSRAFSNRNAASPCWAAMNCWRRPSISSREGSTLAAADACAIPIQAS